MSHYLYVYGIKLVNKRDTEIQVMGLENERIKEVTTGKWSAIVSPCSQKNYEASLLDMQKHEEVLRNFMIEEDVLPLRFSTVCSSEIEVLRMLENYKKDFEKNLSKIAGKLEMGIKVFTLDKQKKPNKIKRIDGEKGGQYIQRMYQQYLKEKGDWSTILPLLEGMHTEMAMLAVTHIKKYPERFPLIYSGDFLVPKEDLQKFIEQAAHYKDKWPELLVKISGPWAPYHFVAVEKEGVDE